MFDLDQYLKDLILECRKAFGQRLLYVGLQGSRLRGEARENSDIDVMVILDGLSLQDMDLYREILKKTGSYERSCGFICGKEEMLRWNPLEVCQIRHSTKDLLGELADYLPPASREDEINYVRLSLGNLYHELCHRYIHAGSDQSKAGFPGLCKNAFFLMQNLCYLESGRFILSKKELKEVLSARDRQILELADRPAGADFDHSISFLFEWLKSVFIRLDQLERNEYTIRLLKEKERDAALQLAWKVFSQYESPDYAPEGTAEFKKTLSDGNYLAGIRYYGAFDRERLAGILAIREEEAHICFFFVDGAYHRRGIGTRLFMRMRPDFPGQTITVNASPYGLPFYRALGFTLADREQTVNGIRFTPMVFMEKKR